MKKKNQDHYHHSSPLLLTVDFSVILLDHFDYRSKEMKVDKHCNTKTFEHRTSHTLLQSYPRAAWRREPSRYQAQCCTDADGRDRLSSDAPHKRHLLSLAYPSRRAPQMAQRKGRQTGQELAPGPWGKSCHAADAGRLQKRYWWWRCCWKKWRSPDGT